MGDNHSPFSIARYNLRIYRNICSMSSTPFPVRMTGLDLIKVLPPSSRRQAALIRAAFDGFESCFAIHKYDNYATVGFGFR